MYEYLLDTCNLLDIFPLWYVKYFYLIIGEIDISNIPCWLLNVVKIFRVTMLCAVQPFPPHNGSLISCVPIHNRDDNHNRHYQAISSVKHKTPQGNNENNGGIIQYFLHSPASDSVRRTDSCEYIWDCLKWSRNLFYIQRHERHSDEITEIEIKYFSSKLEVKVCPWVLNDIRRFRD